MGTRAPPPSAGGGEASSQPERRATLHKRPHSPPPMTPSPPLVHSAGALLARRALTGPRAAHQVPPRAGRPSAPRAPSPVIGDDPASGAPHSSAHTIIMKYDTYLSRSRGAAPGGKADGSRSVSYAPVLRHPLFRMRSEGGCAWHNWAGASPVPLLSAYPRGALWAGGRTGGTCPLCSGYGCTRTTTA